MDRNFPLIDDLSRVPSPCFIVSDDAIKKNLAVFRQIKDETGCRVLLALKGFAMHSMFPLIKETLDGTCASSSFEARLGREYFGREVHTFSAAYSRNDLLDAASYSDYMVFNSFSQWERFGAAARKQNKGIKFGLRVNPEQSESPAAIYDPCAPGSRLGITQAHFKDKSIKGISGLHFHTLCEQNADALERTLDAFDSRFGAIMESMSWLNMGGGHHVTRDDYRIDLLCELIRRAKNRYGVEVYIEPGEAVALNAGILAATVLDIVVNQVKTAILDTSAATHMPDVLEMPYRPEVEGAGKPGEKSYTFRLAGPSCLAGDVIGDYSFDVPLEVGDRVVFHDMAHYSMVKTNMFNGINLPAIARYNAVANEFTLVKTFGFEDYAGRLS
jgi:carboxynorspermidine decarboxylase